MLKKLSRLLLRAKAYASIAPVAWLSIMTWEVNSLRKVFRTSSKTVVRFPALGIVSTVNTMSWRHYYYGLYLAVKEHGVRLANGPAGEIIASTPRGVRVEIRDGQDCGLFGEIFIFPAYESNLADNTVVIDVGMNIGFASLFFAADPHVAVVYSYEPIDANYAQAVHNVRLNPTLVEKVLTHLAAVSDQAGETEMLYSPDLHGSGGLHGFTFGAPTNVVSKQVQLVSCVDVVTDILAKHPGQPLSLKLDAEGAEFEIIPALSHALLLDRFQSIVMETHLKDNSYLIEMIEKAGMVTSQRAFAGSFQAVVTAVRPRKT